MSKRELSRLMGTADVEGSRPKRRRDAPVPPSSSPDVDVMMEDPPVEDPRLNGNSSHVGTQGVKELGLQLWRTIKDAESKDGRLLATVFLKKPPRRLYPDYYQLIHQPIALDDIKKKLDTNGYTSMEVVRADFELLFNNALEYNMKDSGIWIDAKDLLRLVHKTYSRLVPSPEDDGDSDDDKKGKSRVPNLNRMIKSRLQKLVDKQDKNERPMAAEFMELPNRKQWAIYYKQIKKPQCLENIFRRIKRKEYHTTAAFAADVELVFSNAMTFNQEHTPIWEDALALRDYFRQLMSDLPPPHSLPEYSNKIITNKIKIKPPMAPANVQSDSAHKPEPSSSTLFLRVPAASAATAKSSQPIATPPAAKVKPLPSLAPTATAVRPSAATPAKAPVAPQPQLPTQQLQPSIPQTTVKSTPATPQPTPTVQSTTFAYSHYSHPYQPITTLAAPTASSATVALATKVTPGTSSSPAPASTHQIKSVKMRIQPRGRLFWLDHREGVKIWAMRLAPGETGVHIDDLVFVGDEEAEESSEEEGDDDLKQEEEEMDVDGVVSPTKNGKIRRGKTAIRRSQRAAAAPSMRTTRSAAAVANKNKLQDKKKETEKVEEVQLKLNGIAMKEKEERSRQWDVGLPVGSNTLEVGEKGGLMWKVYIERIAD